MNLPNITSILTSAGSIFGTNAAGATPLVQQVVEQVAVGAAASGFLAALQHPDVKAAMLPFDPLGLAAKPVVPAPTPAVPTTHLITHAQAAALGWTTLPAGTGYSD
jgi:hypothetical protein